MSGIGGIAKEADLLQGFIGPGLDNGIIYDFPFPPEWYTDEIRQVLEKTQKEHEKKQIEKFLAEKPWRR